MLLVGLSTSITTVLVLLLTLELAYFTFVLAQYCKYRHLRSFILLVPRVSQSISLILIEFIFLILHLKLLDRFNPLKNSSQDLLFRVFFYSNLIEYAILALNIYLLVETQLSERKKKKTSDKYKEYVEEKSSAFIYQKNIS